MVADYHAFYDKLTEEEIERVGSNILLHTYRMGGDVSDYINPTTKITTVADMLGTYGRPKVLSEMAKCVIVCKPCHKQIHSPNYPFH